MSERQGQFTVGDRVRFSAQGLQCNQHTTHTTGTVTGLMRKGCIRVKRDGLTKEQTWPAYLWELEADDDDKG